MPASVAAVLTVFNRRELTLACLKSIQEQEGVEGRVDVFVLDDASTDGTAEAVAQQFPQAELLHGDGQQYWVGGMRQAFAAAMASDYDFYWWLNDDTTLDRDALARLLDTHDGVEAGMRPALVVGSTRDPLDGGLTYGGRQRVSTRRPMKFELVEPTDPPRQADTMNGNCVLVPREVVRRIGNVDPAFRQQMGDFDYGLRARAAGCSIVVAPGTVGTCADHPPRRTDEQPLTDELMRLGSLKELWPASWATFTRRHAGPFWPAYFLSPYIQRGARLVGERVGKTVRIRG